MIGTGLVREDADPLEVSDDAGENESYLERNENDKAADDIFRVEILIGFGEKVVHWLFDNVVVELELVGGQFDSLDQFELIFKSSFTKKLDASAEDERLDR